MRRNVDTAVFLCAGKAKHMVIFINRSSNRTQAVMAVRQNIRNREFLKAGSTRRLNDSDKCNIVGSQLVKLNLKPFHISGSIVCLQYSIRHGLLCSFLLRDLSSCLTFYCLQSIRCVRNNFHTIYKIRTTIIQFHHCQHSFSFMLYLSEPVIPLSGQISHGQQPLMQF